MPVTIENLTNRPVLLRFNSGQTLHLAPRKTSKEILDVEVKGNAKVEKLEGQHVITLHTIEDKHPAPRRTKRKAEPADKKKPAAKKTETTK
jgi:hypothetical protein